MIMWSGTFLSYMMSRFGFGEKWCSWIGEYIFSASFSALVNGSPSRLQGIRQGDHFSPFLFTMVVEALSALLTMAK